MSSRPWQNQRTKKAGSSSGRENPKRSAAHHGELWSMNTLPGDKALLDAFRLSGITQDQQAENGPRQDELTWILDSRRTSPCLALAEMKL